jgi:hypothetical protein
MTSTKTLINVVSSEWTGIERTVLYKMKDRFISTSDDDDDGDNNSIKFFIYLHAELDSQWPIRVSTNTHNRNNTTKDKTNK